MGESRESGRGRREAAVRAPLYFTTPESLGVSLVPLWAPVGPCLGKVWDQDLVLSALRGRRAAPGTGPRAGTAELGQAHLPGP